VSVLKSDGSPLWYKYLHLDEEGSVSVSLIYRRISESVLVAVLSSRLRLKSSLDGVLH
jgi:hypothetical protein